MNIEIVKYDPIYNDQICELEKENWSPDINVNKSYLQWKYFGNPYSDSPKLYLALDGQKPIAVRGMYETKWQLGASAENFIALCAADVVIHPDYRNKGIFSKLMNYAQNDLNGLGYKYLFSFSAGPASLINSLALGWKSIGRVGTINRPYTRPEIKKLFADKAKKLINKTIGTKYLRVRHTKNHQEFKLDKKMPHEMRTDNKPMPSEMATLVKESVAGNKLVLTRDERFYRWRYSNPLSKYFFFYWHDEQLRGYLIAQTPVYTYDYMNKFNIIELEAASSTIKIKLLENFIHIAESRAISVWSSMLDDDCRNYLTSRRFIESSSFGSAGEYTPTVLAKTSNGPSDNIEFHGTNLLDMNNWELKMVYSDAV